ncbi:hypothetical protein HSX37_11110|uniref:Uncharacterized protein n=1 Tax=Dendrosporobacter quercicolus TaxID=146817 RepID=A0A1G9SXW8_9FIRM|nr:hypothetical protein [Dendrosporobacter quercicolus]NSL48581.1 hypothetical protein [Dendrosporobacter quercicolus DSM 1736]SDM40283.1 hypothetical protein SAMN04488502_104152 [Dendrosporobacter quercicolus]
MPTAPTPPYKPTLPTAPTVAPAASGSKPASQPAAAPAAGWTAPVNRDSSAPSTASPEKPPADPPQPPPFPAVSSTDGTADVPAETALPAGLRDTAAATLKDSQSPAAYQLSGSVYTVLLGVVVLVAVVLTGKRLWKSSAAAKPTKAPANNKTAPQTIVKPPSQDTGPKTKGNFEVRI